MQDFAKTVIVLMLYFVVLTLYIIPTVIYNPLFLAQARKHSKMSSNDNRISSSPLVQLPNVTIGRGGVSSIVTNTIHEAISHNVNILKNTQKLVKQEKYIVQNKLRQVLGEIIPHQYIVVLKNETQDPQILIQQAIDKGANVPFVYYHAIKGFAMKVPNRLVLNSILKDPSVDFVEPDVKVHAFSQIPSTGFSRVGGLSSVNIPHSQTSVSAGIAIIDTGIDPSHPALNVYKQVSFIPGTSTGNDDNGHGTAVAGIAAARDGSFGVIGIAPGARLWAVKVLDSTGTGSISTIIKGIDYVTQNAKQIDAANLSFGCQCSSSALDAAINSSVAAGVTYVVAAGNSGEDVSSWSPANNPNVISVAAIADSDGKCGGLGPPTQYGPDDSLASFSNFGSKVTLAAPGVDIYTTYMGSSYSTLSGTSIAAPFVTGAAALYHSLHPTASPAQVRTALESMGSTASTICNGDGHGYFNNPHGNEPLLYVGNMTGG